MNQWMAWNEILSCLGKMKTYARKMKCFEYPFEDASEKGWRAKSGSQHLREWCIDWNNAFLLKSQTGFCGLNSFLLQFIFEIFNHKSHCVCVFSIRAHIHIHMHTCVHAYTLSIIFLTQFGNSCSIPKLASLDTEDDLLPVFAFLANAIHWATDLHAQLWLEGLL